MSILYGNSIAMKGIKEAVNASFHIFLGPKGVGKATFANQLARYYLCDTKSADCTCKSCLMFNSGNHPDFFYVGKGATANSIVVEDVLPITTAIYSKPYYSQFKVFLIDDFEYATIEAQNKLLKSLEQVPEYIKFIVIASNVFNRFTSRGILPTCVSRGIVHKFYALCDADMRLYLKTVSPDINPDIEDIVHALCDNCPGLATNLLSDFRIIEAIKSFLDVTKTGDIVTTLSCLGLLKEKDKNCFIDSLRGDDIRMILNCLRIFLLDVLATINKGPILRFFSYAIIVSSQGLQANYSNVTKCLNLLDNIKETSGDKESFIILVRYLSTIYKK